VVIKIKPIRQTPLPKREITAAIPLREHLEELRSRLIKSVIAVLITTLFSFIFAKEIFSLLQSRAGNISLIYVEMTEMIETYCVVALTSGLILALPFLIYQLIVFIRPGLTNKEKHYLYIFLPSVFLCFAAGVLFGFFILIPPATEFLISFGREIATPQIRIGNYISLMARLLFAIGLCFETPLIMFFLAKIHILNTDFLSRYRKFAFVGAFIIGAVITPTFDPVNQTLVALPLYILFEAGILLAKIARRGEKKQAALSGISRI
jgi:sec-independent protein translocase protein TatC